MSQYDEARVSPGPGPSPVQELDTATVAGADRRGQGAPAPSAFSVAPVNAWTVADQAELDVLVWHLVDGYREHRQRCRACQPDPEPGAPYPCPHLQAAIREVCDWREKRRLLTRAEELRIARRVELEGLAA